MDNVVFNRIWYIQCLIDLWFKNISVWVFENGTRSEQKKFFFLINIFIVFIIEKFFISIFTCKLSVFIHFPNMYEDVICKKCLHTITDLLNKYEAGWLKMYTKKKTCLVAGHCVTSSHGLREDPIWWLFSVDDFYFYKYSL